MKPKAYKTVVLAGLAFWAALAPAFGQTRPEERLIQEAKVLLFDEKWSQALEKLEALLEEYPSSPTVSQARFYKAKCLSRLDGREPEALAAFQDYLKDKERTPSLTEESEVAVIDLAFKLVARGNKSFLKEIESRLSSSNKIIRYYAAFKMSYLKDRAVASRSVPVLINIIESEKDAELMDRAKIALLRVDPKALEGVKDSSSQPPSRLMRIEVIEDGKKKLSINIPWALADLALQAIPNEEKQMLRQKGYDLERIMKDLEKTKASVIEIREENTLIKIWID